MQIASYLQSNQEISDLREKIGLFLPQSSNWRRLQDGEVQSNRTFY